MVDRELRTLSNALGGSRELALFEAFALRSDSALSIPDASDFAGVAWATAHRLVQAWVAKGVLQAVEKRRKSLLYRLNLESPTIQLLARAAQLAIRERLDSDLLDEGFPEFALEPYNTIQTLAPTGSVSRLVSRRNLTADTMGVPSTSNTTTPLASSGVGATGGQVAPAEGLC
jgi:hypothetical protein